MRKQDYNARAKLMELAGLRLDDLRRETEDGERADAISTVFLSRELEDLDARVFEVEYPELKARALVPIKTVPVGTEFYKYRMWDYQGAAVMISSWAEDIPTVAVSKAEYAAELADFALAYDMTIKEIRAALKAGLPLEDLKAREVRRLMEVAMNTSLLTGNTAKGYTGLLNNANVPTVTPVTGSWGPSTSLDVVLADCAALINAAEDNTLSTRTPDTWVMAKTIYNYLRRRRVSDGSAAGRTFLDEILAIHPEIRRVEWLIEANTAGSGSSERMMVYPGDPEVLEGIVETEYETFDPERRGMVFKTIAHACYGGVEFRYPLSCAYMDNVLA